MTKTMHPTLALGFDWGSITTPLVTLFSGLGGGGILMAWLDRKSKRDDAKRQDQKEARHDDASVETKKLELDASERDWYRKELKANDDRREKDTREMRSEMATMRRTFGHEIRALQQYATSLQDIYHLLHNAAVMLDMQNRILRAEMQELLGDKFNASKFPLVDLSLFDPKHLPRFQPTNGWDEAANDKKITGKVTITPDNP